MLTLQLAALLIAVTEIASSQRIWAPQEVPVAFWSWRLETPSQIDLNEAIRQTAARTLFLRAGQIDYEGGKLARIRPVSGPIPAGISIHLVYNATRSLLKSFEQIDTDAAGETIAGAFTDDLIRARNDGSQIAGVQLDFDVPTRLLPSYAAILRNIRAKLSTEMKLSITGLPTWLDSTSLAEALSSCDFWVPQCYGAQIPERLDQRIPIATPEHVARSIEKTRDLGVPYYAGLAAYGYAIHYSRQGSLIGLRGDLDPLLVVSSPEFELIDQTPFALRRSEATEKNAGEWRLLYRARRDVIIDGAAVRSGETLLLDRPTAAGLRACAREVRKQPGANFLGICVFRIPTKADYTTLSLSEIACALSDADPHFSLDARSRTAIPGTNDLRTILILEMENDGSIAARPGEDALTILVRVPTGSLDSVTVDRFATAETFFESGTDIVTCTTKRANAVRLSVGWFPPGERITAKFEMRGKSPDAISLRYAATLDDGSVIEGSRLLRQAGAR
jgi:hypothetical protein